MSTFTAISPETVRAYRRAVYRVCAAPPWALRVGVASAELAAAQRRHGVACSAYVTACNPLDCVADDAVNAERQRALRLDIDCLGLVCLDGLGTDETGDWPGEPSFLVFGLQRSAAETLGRKYRQNAVVCSGADGKPELALLR